MLSLSMPVFQIIYTIPFDFSAQQLLIDMHK